MGRSSYARAPVAAPLALGYRHALGATASVPSGSATSVGLAITIDVVEREPPEWRRPAASAEVSALAPNILRVHHWERLRRGELYAATPRVDRAKLDDFQRIGRFEVNAGTGARRRTGAWRPPSTA